MHHFENMIHTDVATFVSMLNVIHEPRATAADQLLVCMSLVKQTCLHKNPTIFVYLQVHKSLKWLH